MTESRPLSILMVCTGNICRSPMAEAMLRRAVDDRPCEEEVVVASAGTWAHHGDAATPEAQAAAGARGGALSDHRSRALVPDEVQAADLVIAMTSVHLREIETIAPGSGRKTRLLKELVELEPQIAGGSLHDRSAAILAAVRPAARRSLDLDDPIGLPMSAYDRCAREISASVDRLASWLCDEPRSAPSSDLG